MSTQDTSSAPPPVPIPASLTGTLRSLARRDLAFAWLAGLGRILTLFLGLGVLRCLFDFWMQLDWAVRAVFLAIDFLIIGWLAWRYLVKPWKRRLGVRTAALRLERVFPSLGSRVIAAVQLPAQVQRENISRELVTVVVCDAAFALSQLRWRDAAPAKPALRWLGYALGCLVVGVGLAAIQPKTGAVLARRWLLSHEAPVTRTKLALAQQDLQIPVGSPLSLGATATGVIPKQSVFELKPSVGDDRSFPIDAAPDAPGVFTLKIDNVQQSFRYRVRAGDARSEWHDVVTLPAPAVLESRFTVEAPAYTGLAPARSDGQVLVVPAGSTLRIEGRSSLPLTAAQADLWTNPNDTQPVATAALKIDPNPLAFSGSIVVNQPVSAITLPLVATNAIASQADTRLAIRYVPDAPPVVDITGAPADNELGIPSTLYFMRGRTADDYGVSRMTFCWEISRKDTTVTPVTGRRDLNLPSRVGRSADFAVTISTGAPSLKTPDAVPLAVAPGDVISWWIEAADNAPTPNVSTSPRRALKIVTPEEKLAEMMGRLREGMGELDETSRSQEEISNALQKLLKPAPQK